MKEITSGELMHFTFVRHGQTDWNLKKLLQGQTDVPLNDTGRAQAQTTRENLQGKVFDLVYTSPLSRAVEVAKIITASKKNFIILPDLTAADYGEFEGRPIQEVIETNIPGTQIFRRGAVYTGETYAQILARCENVLKQILDEAEQGKEVLVVSHSGTFKGISVVLGIGTNVKCKNCIPYRFALDDNRHWIITEIA